MWHSWFIRQNAKRTKYRAVQISILTKCWASWCRHLLQNKLKLLTKEHRFLISLQNRHALQATHRIILRAVSKSKANAVSNVANRHSDFY